jgi:hypothetical protein
VALRHPVLRRNRGSRGGSHRRDRRVSVTSVLTKKLCRVCDRPSRANGLCKTHDQRQKAWGDVRADLPIRARMATPFCTIGECAKPHKGHGMCGMHVWRFQKYGTAEPEHYKPRLCQLDGCFGKHVAFGYCGPHYRRWTAHGDPFESRKFPHPPSCNECGNGKPVGAGLMFPLLHERLEKAQSGSTLNA